MAAIHTKNLEKNYKTKTTKTTEEVMQINIDTSKEQILILNTYRSEKRKEYYGKNNENNRRKYEQKHNNMRNCERRNSMRRRMNGITG